MVVDGASCTQLRTRCHMLQTIAASWLEQEGNMIAIQLLLNANAKINAKDAR